MNELIREKMHFSEFFEEDERVIKDELYEDYQVNEILKGINEGYDTSEILGYAYESQRGNQLLLITFSVLKKLEEKGFMEELEKNYGIYLGVDSFVQEIKEKLKEIKNFKSLYQFIGTELGEDKTELELIAESYEKAKNRGYLKDPNERYRASSAQIQVYQSSSYRGNKYRGQRNGGSYYGYRYGNKYIYNQRW